MQHSIKEETTLGEAWYLDCACVKSAYHLGQQGLDLLEVSPHDKVVATKKPYHQETFSNLVSELVNFSAHYVSIPYFLIYTKFTSTTHKNIVLLFLTPSTPLS